VEVLARENSQNFGTPIYFCNRFEASDFTSGPLKIPLLKLENPPLSAKIHVIPK